MFEGTVDCLCTRIRTRTRVLCAHHVSALKTLAMQTFSHTTVYSIPSGTALREPPGSSDERRAARAFHGITDYHNNNKNTRAARQPWGNLSCGTEG